MLSRAKKAVNDINPTHGTLSQLLTEQQEYWWQGRPQPIDGNVPSGVLLKI